MSNLYVEPTRYIDESAIKVNGLQNGDGDLYLQSFSMFLQKFAGVALLTAHNASFDQRFLIRNIMKYSLITEFSSVIYGFCDTLKLFRVKFPHTKGKGMMTLSKLSQDLLPFEVESENFHEATYNVIIFKKLGKENFTNEMMFASAKSFKELLKGASKKRTIKNNTTKSEKKLVCKKNVESFKLLKRQISNYMIRKLLTSNISYETFKEIYKKEGEEAVIRFLAHLIIKHPL